VGGGTGRFIAANTSLRLTNPHIGQVRTTTGNLNVRRGPGTNYPIIGSIPRNHHVVVVGIGEVSSTHSSQQWYLVYINGTTTRGYVSAPFLHISYTSNRWEFQVVTSGSNLNMRAQANTTSTILGNAQNGARRVMLHGTTTNGFRNVAFRGLGAGWMHRDFLGTPS